MSTEAASVVGDGDEDEDGDRYEKWQGEGRLLWPVRAAYGSLRA